MANLSRVAVWWRVVDWTAATVFSATAVPAAALGARTLVALDPRAVEATLGAFFLLMIPARRWLLARGFRIGLPQLALVGAGIGFMSGIVATVGPVNTPFFLAYGLVKGAYLSTEALGSAAMGITKAVVFRTFGAMPLETLLRGLLIGASLTAGSWIAKGFVLRMDSQQFRHVMDALLAVSGLVMLWGALT
jgi:uncharacterized membrane protein YfcA